MKTKMIGQQNEAVDMFYYPTRSCRTVEPTRSCRAIEGCCGGRKMINIERLLP